MHLLCPHRPASTGVACRSTSRRPRRLEAARGCRCRRCLFPRRRGRRGPRWDESEAFDDLLRERRVGCRRPPVAPRGRSLDPAALLPASRAPPVAVCRAVVLHWLRSFPVFGSFTVPEGEFLALQHVPQCHPHDRVAVFGGRRGSAVGVFRVVGIRPPRSRAPARPARVVEHHRRHLLGWRWQRARRLYACPLGRQPVQCTVRPPVVHSQASADSPELRHQPPLLNGGGREEALADAHSVARRCSDRGERVESRHVVVRLRYRVGRQAEVYRRGVVRLRVDLRVGYRP